jgi:hypothetical protein
MCVRQRARPGRVDLERVTMVDSTSQTIVAVQTAAETVVKVTEQPSASVSVVVTVC